MTKERHTTKEKVGILRPFKHYVVRLRFQQGEKNETIEVKHRHNKQYPIKASIFTLRAAKREGKD